MQGLGGPTKFSFPKAVSITRTASVRFSERMQSYTTMRTAKQRPKEPKSGRPHLPGYGVSKTRKELLPWPRTKNYFLATTRVDGRMFSQMFAISPGIIDLKGDLRIIYTTVREPTVLLGVVGLPRGAYRIGQRGALIVMFAAISFLIARLTDLHVGGAGNYFLEHLFAVVPLAVLGVLRLIAR